MRRAAAALLGCLAVLLAFGATAGAALLEPVTVLATAPEAVEAGKPFKLEVAVEAEAGALDIAAQPLTLGVKLAPECGGSLAGTAGAPVLLKTLPSPAAGTAYAQTVSGPVTASGSGPEVVCAFLQDAQERQFATDTEAEVNVVPSGSLAACTATKKQAKSTKRSLKRLEHRIKKVKKAIPKAQGTHRKALAHKLHQLKTHKRKAQKRHKLAVKKSKAACA